MHLGKEATLLSKDMQAQSSFAASLTRMAVRVQETYRSVDSRMAQESLRRYVLRVLRVWRSWFIFSDDFLNGLQVRERTRSVASWASSAGCASVWHFWSAMRSARCKPILSPSDLLSA